MKILSCNFSNVCVSDSYLFFFRLSLQYHPDKNKNKGAQSKFEEINNGNLLTYKPLLSVACLTVQFKIVNYFESVNWQSML